MKKLGFLLGIFLSTSIFVNAQGKIGYVNTDEVFALMPEVKKADSDLATYQQTLADTYQKQQEELNNAYAKFVKDSATMTPAVKEAKRKDLQDRITDLQSKEGQLNQSLEAEKEKLLQPIRAKMLKAIQDVAKENAIAHVFYLNQVIVYPPANDITSKVKAKLKIK